MKHISRGHIFTQRAQQMLVDDRTGRGKTKRGRCSDVKRYRARDRSAVRVSELHAPFHSAAAAATTVGMEMSRLYANVSLYSTVSDSIDC